MTRSVTTLLALTTLLVAVSWGLYFDQQKFLDWADEHYDDEPFETFSDNWGSYDWDVHKGECGHFVMRAMAEAAPELARYLWCRGRFNPNCDVEDARYNDGLPRLHLAIPWLRDHAGWEVKTVKVRRYDYDLPPAEVGRIFGELKQGDIVGIEPWSPRLDGHAGIIYDKGSGNRVGWRDHGKDPPQEDFFGDNPDKGPFRDFWYSTPINQEFTLLVVRPHSDLSDIAWSSGYDSTWTKVHGQPYRGQGGYKFNLWKCCWHENIGGTWPWYADSTGYACLSWTEDHGTTIDSLISPRINLAGRFGAVFMQNSICDLRDNYGPVVEILLTTDDGATWDTINTGRTQPQAIPIPAADDKRDVRDRVGL
jgi:hypothetical protein